MLPIEKQCTSLEISKKLKELGVRQESLFYWRYDPKTGDATYGPTDNLIYQRKKNGKAESMGPTSLDVSAFTVSELGDMLPVTIKMNGETHWYECNKTRYKHRCGYIYDHEGTQGWGELSESSGHSVGVAETEADARAKMLIYLIENNLITLN
jgi:hypothetical protein